MRSSREHLMSKKFLVEFSAKKSVARNLKFFFVGSFYYSSSRLRGESERKGAIYEIESHFREKYNLDK